jgi:hypothetical protein
MPRLRVGYTDLTQQIFLNRHKCANNFQAGDQ